MSARQFVSWVATTAAGLMLVAWAPSRASTTVPEVMSYQGYLTNAAGTPRQGAFKMSFSMFADSTGGAALWSETYAAVTVSGGVFGVMLGTVNPLPATEFTGARLWLETAVSDTTLAPRRPLVTVPYSFHAHHAHLADTASVALWAVSSGGSCQQCDAAMPAPGMGVVWIREGSFTLGSPGTEVDRSSDEGPQTQVSLTHGFWMGRTEVTQAQYLAVTGANPSFFTGDLTRPVETVSWNNAVAYCATLTTTERTAGRCPANWSYRLPTEAEWEYAARAGTAGTRFSYGDDPGYTLLTNYAWYSSNSGSTTHSVGGNGGNGWGLFDMYGNVWEWCQDRYGTYSGGSVIDPQGPGSGSIRVVRGGSWLLIALFCRSARRYGGGPTNTYSDIGFRVVLAPVQP